MRDKTQSKATHWTLFIHTGWPLSWKASICFYEAQRCVSVQCWNKRPGSISPFIMSHRYLFTGKASCVCATKTKCTQVKDRKKRCALISAVNTSQGQLERTFSNSMLIKWCCGAIRNPPLDADEVLSSQKNGEIILRNVSFPVHNTTAKVNHSEVEQ